MRLRAADDILRRGLTPLFPETLVGVFSVLILAHRSRAAAPILLLPAADIWRVGRRRFYRLLDYNTITQQR